jgi:hypothetical protein
MQPGKALGPGAWDLTVELDDRRALFFGLGPHGRRTDRVRIFGFFGCLT